MAQIVAGNNKFIGFNPGLMPEFINYSDETTDTMFAQDVRNLPYSNQRGVALITSQLCYSSQRLSIFEISVATPAKYLEMSA